MANDAKKGKSDWTAEEYATFAAENLMGWHIEEYKGKRWWFSSDGRCMWLAWGPVDVAELIMFSPHHHWLATGPVLEVLRKEPLFVSLYSGCHQGIPTKDVHMCGYSSRYLSGPDTHVQAPTVIEVIEVFCYELSQLGYKINE